MTTKALYFIILGLCVVLGYVWFKPKDNSKVKELENQIDVLKYENDSISEDNFILASNFEVLEKQRDSLEAKLNLTGQRIDSLKTSLKNANNHNYSNTSNADVVDLLSNIIIETGLN